MKIKFKIFMVFIFSIIVSVILFVFAVYYLMTHSYFSGITPPQMNYITEDLRGKIISENASSKDIENILLSYKNENPQMDFEILLDNNEILYSTASSDLQINSINELMLCLSSNNSSTGKWGVTRKLDLENYKNAYLITIVQEKYFTSIYFTLNTVKGIGILGKIFILGVLITVSISSLFAYLLSKNMSYRFNNLFNAIHSFNLGNTTMDILDESSDELGTISKTFNSMAQKIQLQFDEENALQEQKRQLISNISHDLRTPLTSIIGYSESLDNGIYNDDEEQKKYISIIRRKALYMEKLLSELLEFSRIDSQKFELFKENTDICELSREIIIEYLPLLESKNLILDIEIPDSQLVASVDKERLSRVIRNLIDNAIKYGSDGGSIIFSVIDLDTSFSINIKDFGVGMDEENLPLIFNRFYTCNKGRNSINGGLGLGLAISEEIIKMHGGSITVSSKKNKGTLFSITLPKK